MVTHINENMMKQHEETFFGKRMIISNQKQVTQGILHELSLALEAEPTNIASSLKKKQFEIKLDDKRETDSLIVNCQISDF